MNLQKQKERLEAILAIKPNTSNIKEEIRQHDVGDMSMDLSNLATEVIRLDTEQKMLVGARAAHIKMHHGTYTICSECDREIDEKRLVAVPWAIFCSACQNAREKREKGGIVDFVAGDEDLTARV